MRSFVRKARRTDPTHDYLSNVTSERYYLNRRGVLTSLCSVTVPHEVGL